MIISNVNIGTGVGVGDGDSLYAAFYKVNQNFANLQSNVNALSNSVSSVAGRTGNVTLTIADVVGLATTYASQANITTANTLMKGYVDGQITAANSAPNTANIGMLGYVNLANTIQSAIITSSNSSMKNYVDGQITAANSAPVVLASNVTSSFSIAEATTGGATTFHLVSAAGQNISQVKNSAGKITGWYIYNSNGSARKVNFYNVLSPAPTVGTTPLLFSVVIPALSAANCPFPAGIDFSNGIYFVNIKTENALVVKKLVVNK